ncbi:MAG: hypothetical protein HF976_06425 [ANME-2 cluster archaeon]|nr:hypothetical protein [ANME-2 cluster archaeon]MBC2701036.1 hypothetical protein [ANME-2 cluster archaeon]MBC2707723.1 hypothetical protein [ANME-2 cluster archaeon]MBC2747391.1 hypothetical protein [ANME-2 cluster archaeon]
MKMKMNKEWIFLIILTGYVCAVPFAASATGFAVGPPSINLTVPVDGENTIVVYVTSHDYDGEVVVGTENIPLRVSPKVIQLSDTDENRRIELTFYGNRSVKEETYSGKLTFLGSTEKNIVGGVKIKVAVTQISRADAGAGGIQGSIIDSLRANSTVIIGTLLVMVSLILGIGIGRRRK